MCWMFLQSLPEFRAKVSVVHVHQYKSILFYFFCFSFLTQAQCVCLQCRRPGFNSWVGKIPWRRKWQSTPALLSGKSHGQRSLIGYSPWGRKESDTTERLHFTFSTRFVIAFLPKNTQGWSHLEWTGWISLQSKGLSRVFSNTTVQKHQFIGASFLHSPTLASIHDHWKNHSLD